MFPLGLGLLVITAFLLRDSSSRTAPPQAPSQPQTPEEASWTEGERRSGACRTETSDYEPEIYERLVGLRNANRAFVSRQWDPNFLRTFVDASRARGEEIGVIYDAESHRIALQYANGEGGGVLPAVDVTRYNTILHTHPRATAYPVAATMFSQSDLISLLIFSVSQQTTTSATVIGRICGGPLETSQIAVSGNTIFVTNSYELGWISHNLRILPSPARDILRRAVPEGYRVEVNPARVNEIGARSALPADIQASILRTLNTPQTE